jgi:hypothetical protein
MQGEFLIKQESALLDIGPMEKFFQLSREKVS